MRFNKLIKLTNGIYIYTNTQICIFGEIKTNLNAASEV